MVVVTLFNIYGSTTSGVPTPLCMPVATMELYKIIDDIKEGYIL